jgi:hypothetical protein
MEYLTEKFDNNDRRALVSHLFDAGHQLAVIEKTGFVLYMEQPDSLRLRHPGCDFDVRRQRLRQGCRIFRNTAPGSPTWNPKRGRPP